MRIDLRNLKPGDGFQFLGGSTVFKVINEHSYGSTSVRSILSMPEHAKTVCHQDWMNDKQLCCNGGGISSHKENELIAKWVSSRCDDYVELRWAQYGYFYLSNVGGSLLGDCDTTEEAIAEVRGLLYSLFIETTRQVVPMIQVV